MLILPISFRGGVVAGGPANGAPVFSAYGPFSIAENAANNSVVGSVAASDPEGHGIAYTIASGNDLGIFAIHNSSGQITIASNAGLNYEAANAHSLTIRATDNGTPPRSTNQAVSITVTDVNDAPLFTSGTAFTLAENAANSSVVATIAASPVEAGQTISYAIISGNSSGVFELHSSSGALTVANSSLLDYETVSSYSLTIRATDNGSPAQSADQVIYITLTNVTEAPVNSVLPVISGTAALGQVLMVSNGSWSGLAPITYSYQWERGGTAISGATGNSYTLVSADVGQTLTCVITASNADGSANAESAATAVVSGGSSLQSLNFNGSAYLSMTPANFGSVDTQKSAFVCAFQTSNITTARYLFAMSKLTGTTSRLRFYVQITNSGLRFQGEDASNNFFRAQKNSILTANQWHAIMVYFDLAAASASRLRIWLDGSELSGFTSYTAPTGAFGAPDEMILLGAGYSASAPVNHFNGLIYQPCFFSGTLPNASDVFDGSGKLKDLSALTGLYSRLDGSSAVADSVLSTDWTNSSVTTSSTVPS